MDSLLDELRQLEAEFHHHGHLPSLIRLEQLLHADFHEIGRSGRRYDRETVVNFLRSNPALPPVNSVGHAVQWLAEGCALLTYRSEQRSADGAGVDATWRSSVWLRTERGWQVVFHQGTPAAPPA
ncbi:nuclear transport factor 2 family protein [Azohydromonas australica]|uniref:nuclear transport factor 2 family protein n=1 Tax=Azohydromonas australica TaxID=364039 RepID=UPI00048C222D|nr:DUF4440 domain-containing protein [Azohydromonas australica]